MSKRNLGVDLARVFAAGGIVWIHANNGPAQEWARPCLSFFAATLAFFGWKHLGQENCFRHYITSRASRLLVPFLIWSAIHALLFGIRLLLCGTPPPHIQLWSPLFGTNYHLWFLPFAAFVTVGMAALYPVLAKYDLRYRVLVLLFLCLALSVGPTSDVNLLLVHPWLHPLGSWRAEAPTVLLGMIFAEIEPKMNASFAVLMLIVALALKAVLPSGIYMVNTFVGASLLIVAVKTPLPSPQSVQSLARISFFVYLVHLIPLSILRGPVAELGMHGVALGVVLTGIAWAASNLTGLICLRLRWGWPIMP